MGKRIKKIYRAVVFIMVVFLWLFSLYRILSDFGLTAFGTWSPPDPPSPPCPSCCQVTPTPTPSCGQPTPTPTPTPEITPSPNPEPSVTLAPTPIPTTPPTTDNGGSGGPAEPPKCESATPSTPFLRTLIKLGNGKVKLVWDPVDSATGYAISYGPKPGNYLYGVSNTGKVNSFDIGSLREGNYCFAVRALNDCAPGGLSNEKCINEVLGTGIGGAVLGAKTPKVLAATGNSLDDYLIFVYVKPVFGSKKFEQNNAVNISIAQVGINLAISAGKTDGDLWDISQTGASYLAGSGKLGESGNTIVYGHNKNNLFGPIRWLEKGAEIKIKDSTGRILIYQVVETKTVSPDQTEILLPTSDSTLTLYTCDGIGDNLRFVVIAKLTS